MVLGAEGEEMRKLKTYVGCFDGTYHIMVAATTKKEAAARMHISVYTLNQFGSDTGNHDDIMIAEHVPGVVFRRKMYSRGTEDQWLPCPRLNSARD